MRHVASLKQVRILRLAGRHGRGGATAAGLLHLTALSFLDTLVLSHSAELESQGLQHVAPLPTLRHLDLSQCWRVDDAGLAFLSSSGTTKFAEGFAQFGSPLMLRNLPAT